MVPKCLENGSLNSIYFSGNADILPGSAYVCLAVYLFLLIFFGILCNGVIIYLYFARQDLSTNTHKYIVALCFCGLLISMSGVPLTVAATLSRKWVFGDSLCRLYGFTLTSLGITMIALLTGIAIDKYIIIVKFHAAHRVTKTYCIFTIVLCFTFGILWGIFPLLGWNAYRLETAELSCSITWNTDSMMYHSYSISLLCVGLVLPVAVIIYLYSSILQKIRTQRKVSRRLLSNVRRRSSERRERKIAVTVLLMVGAFILSWLPYSIFAVLSILGFADQISPLWQTIPSMFAKGSILWNPLLYGSRNAAMKKALLETFPFYRRFLSTKRNSHESIELPAMNNKTVEISQESDSVFTRSSFYNRKRSSVFVQ